jgi:hypothetical protein
VLSLIATLIGVAVLFIAQEADFLAAVQVIVYAGAIVVLFLFVIMLFGVDRSERHRGRAVERSAGRPPWSGWCWPYGRAPCSPGSVTGERASPDPVVSSEPDVEAIGRPAVHRLRPGLRDHLGAPAVIAVLSARSDALARHRGAARVGRSRRDLGRAVRHRAGPSTPVPGRSATS